MTDSKFEIVMDKTCTPDNITKENITKENITKEDLQSIFQEKHDDIINNLIPKKKQKKNRSCCF